mmetsp:Transcript_141751/g.353400  ORF Transcript_141751/g.353400 Transcript_141751/m.353400 type:complete len:204 (+) Transcript_141751:349-960(+)
MPLFQGVRVAAAARGVGGIRAKEFLVVQLPSGPMSGWRSHSAWWPPPCGANPLIASWVSRKGPPWPRSAWLCCQKRRAWACWLPASARGIHACRRGSWPPAPACARSAHSMSLADGTAWCHLGQVVTSTDCSSSMVLLRVMATRPKFLSTAAGTGGGGGTRRCGRGSADLSQKPHQVRCTWAPIREKPRTVLLRVPNCICSPP